MEPVRLGVIGGSGVYDMQSLTDIEEVMPKTPFGDPSDAIVVGTLGGQRVAFLPRHGRGHRISPTELNSRANIFALKSLGVERIVAISACGSLREDYAPRQIVIPDQILDPRTMPHAKLSSPTRSSTAPGGAHSVSSAMAWWSISASPSHSALAYRSRSTKL
jgi:purine nucleoside phosphorylase